MEGPFNDIHEWQYEKICDMLGGGVGHKTRAFGEFVTALDQASADTNNLHVLNVLLDPKDRSTAMTRVAQRLAKRLSTT